MNRRPHRGPLTVDEYAEWNASRLAQQPVTRRSVLRAVMAGAGGYAAAQFRLARVAFAAGGGTLGSTATVISGRHLSFVQGRDGRPDTAMAVTAQLVSKTGSLPAGLRAYVEVGAAAGHYGTRFDAGIVHLVGQYAIPGGPVGSQFYAKATLGSLAPGTVHHYRLVLSDGATSGDAHFATAPATRLTRQRRKRLEAPFTFTAFADVGTNRAPTDPGYAWGDDPAGVKANGGSWPRGVFDNAYSSSDPVAGANGTDIRPALTQTALMATQRPVFTLLAGDICYADPSGSGLPADDSGIPAGTTEPGTNRYNPYVWDVFLSQIESQAAFTPWMFATGNHDMEPLYGATRFLGDSAQHGYGGHAHRLDLPTNGPRGCPSVYRFVYANVAVLSVDANELSHEIQTNTGYSGGAQLRWVEDTLRLWRTDPVVAPTVDFVVAFCHHCAYSTAHHHGSDGGVRAALDPLFSRYQVDLVVQGHNHLFERTDPIRYGAPTRTAPDGSTVDPTRDGVTYICAGSGGRARQPFRPAPGASAPAPAGVAPRGAQLLPEGQRYRGYAPPGGPNATENNTEQVVNTFHWTAAGTALSKTGYPQGRKVAESVSWSQVRYDDYAFIAVDVVPAVHGAHTTMTIRTLADALPGTQQPYTEIDRITLRRSAGTSRIPSVTE